MLALNPGSNHLLAEPFPYMVLDQALPPNLFAALRDSYPDCPPGSGPTGRTIHRGDELFDAQMAAHPAWAELYAYCNSPEFLSRVATLFASEIDRSATVQRSELRFADHVETREEKEAARIARPHLPREAMFTRFDFMQGMESYTRESHLDHRRRLATMLIYFDSPGPESFSGGDLVLHDRVGKAVMRVSPAENRAVLFPCSERSWHSVEAVHRCHRPRRFIQVSISGCHDIWPDAQLPGRSRPRQQSGWIGRAARAVRRFSGR